jgi:ABC-2 type transport system permease protein
VRIVAMFLVPVAFVNFVPVSVVTGHMSAWWLAGIPAAVIGSVLLAVGVYRLGLRAYDSAGH